MVCIRDNTALRTSSLLTDVVDVATDATKVLFSLLFSIVFSLCFALGVFMTLMVGCTSTP